MSTLFFNNDDNNNNKYSFQLHTHWIDYDGFLVGQWVQMGVIQSQDVFFCLLQDCLDFWTKKTRWFKRKFCPYQTLPFTQKLIEPKVIFSFLFQRFWRMILIFPLVCVTVVFVALTGFLKHINHLVQQCIMFYFIWRLFCLRLFQCACEENKFFLFLSVHHRCFYVAQT